MDLAPPPEGLLVKGEDDLGSGGGGRVRRSQSTVKMGRRRADGGDGEKVILKSNETL